MVDALADIAPTLKEAELRVLLELARRARKTEHKTVKASSRELANACKLARSKTVAALDSLCARCLISTRQGTATTPSAHIINLLPTAQIGGPLTGPPQRENRSPKGTTLDLFGDHPGPQGGPPPLESTALNAISAASDFDSASLRLIDQILSARPTKADPNDLAAFTHWLHGYMRKFGRDETNRPIPEPHPPTPDLVAQFLAIAEPRRLGTLLDSLALDRKTCHSYGWFVAVALQRIHGITVNAQKAIRAQLRDVKKPKPPEPEQTNFLAEISSLAKTKGFR